MFYVIQATLVAINLCIGFCFQHELAWLNFITASFCCGLIVSRYFDDRRK